MAASFLRKLGDSWGLFRDILRQLLVLSVAGKMGGLLGDVLDGLRTDPGDSG